MKIQSGFYTNKTSFKKQKQADNKPRIVNNPYSYDDYFSRMEYKKPVTLQRALYDIINEKELNDGVVGEKATIQRFLQDLKGDKKILDRKILALSGYGSAAAAFESADGKIIKLTDGNHFPMNRPVGVFDVPVYKKGHNGKTYYYIEEKLYRHNLPSYLVDTVKDMIKQSGYKTVDLYEGDMHQIGMARNGRVYLLDAECAQYKTVFHALFDKAKRALLKTRV